MTKAFSNYTPKMGSFFPDQSTFILQQTLQLNKFEGVNFKYNNGFSEFQPENIEIKHFLS